MPTKEQILETIKYRPVEIGRWVGFNKLTELHNEWLRQFLFNQYDMTLQAHRGSYKTTTLSLFMSLHTLIRPNETIIYMRKTDTDVKEIGRQVFKILSTGAFQEMSQILHGKTVAFLRNSGNEIDTNLHTGYLGASQIVGLGLGTSITGKHGDIVITDDIVNVSDRKSKAERDKTKLAYQELQNVKNRGGRFINTGTPWHIEDCFTLMPNIQKYDCYSTGLMSQTEIDDIKGSMTPSLFAANYELRHIPSDEIIFADPNVNGDPVMVQQGISHIDAAYGGEDYTAFTICKLHNGTFYLYGRMWHKHVDDVMEEISKLHNQFMCGRMFAEDNGDKGYLVKELRRRFSIRAFSYHENMNKDLKITTYLKGAWRNVVFVAGTDKEYIQQICDYTEEAEHDDAPDSAASIIRQLWRKQ